jgi:hypothetical protein
MKQSNAEAHRSPCHLVTLSPCHFRYFGWTVAALLFLLVLLSPLADNGIEHPDGVQRLIALLARDATVRRTLFASAVGLAVTASVFFRSSRSSPKPGGRTPRQPPPKIVGA